MQLNMLEAMNIYVNVVEQGSFTRAADALELHRPAVTRAIQNLEHDLGVKLLHRTTRQVSMTDEGEEFYQRCLSLLSELDDVRRLFSSTQPPKGRLRLDIPIALARAVIIPALRDFQNRYPDIEIILGTSDRKIDLIAERVDCVIRLGELDDSSFVAKRLGTAGMVTCAAPSYLVKYGTPQTIEELMTSHRAVNFFSNHSLQIMDGLAPIFPYTFYHLTHYWFAAADIPVANDTPVHYADAIRCNVRRPPRGSLPLLTRRVSA